MVHIERPGHDAKGDPIGKANNLDERSPEMKQGVKSCLAIFLLLSFSGSLSGCGLGELARSDFLWKTYPGPEKPEEQVCLITTLEESSDGTLDVGDWCIKSIDGVTFDIRGRRNAVEVMPGEHVVVIFFSSRGKIETPSANKRILRWKQSKNQYSLTIKCSPGMMSHLVLLDDSIDSIGFIEKYAYTNSKRNWLKPMNVADGLFSPLDKSKAKRVRMDYPKF
jgi:hypothetical protein